MMKRLLAALAVVISTASVADTGQAITVMPCTSTKTMMSTLSERYGERVVIYGSSDVSVIAVMANLKTGSFTMLEIRGEIACVLATGNKFEVVPLSLDGELKL